MSGLTGTQRETLYSMPASGAAVTAAAATVMSGSTAANPAYLLPGGFFNPQEGTKPGKALLIKGGGSFSTPTAGRTTIFTAALDTTAGTLSAIVLGKTGIITTLTTTATWGFDFELQVTLTAQGVGATAGTLNTIGWVEYGIANNAATGTLGTYTSNNPGRFLIGAPQTAVTFNTLTGYYAEVFNTWDATTNAPTITLTNYTIECLN
jgi:hypothetical protein